MTHFLGKAPCCITSLIPCFSECHAVEKCRDIISLVSYNIPTHWKVVQRVGVETKSLFQVICMVPPTTAVVTRLNSRTIIVIASRVWVCPDLAQSPQREVSFSGFISRVLVVFQLFVVHFTCLVKLFRFPLLCHSQFSPEPKNAYRQDI